MRHIALFAAVSLATTLAACSSSSTDAADGGSGGSAGSGGSGGSAGGQAVSLANDVMPIFQVSCGISGSCHGDATSSQENLYLAPPLSGGPATAADAKAVYAFLVAKSQEAPTVARVVPGDPAGSFLMAKIDGTQATGFTCVAPYATCGASMPQSSSQLDAAKRDVVRAWIQQGAKNN